MNYLPESGSAIWMNRHGVGGPIGGLIEQLDTTCCDSSNLISEQIVRMRLRI